MWVLLFVAIAVLGAVVLVRLLLRLWRKARALLDEVDVLAGQAGQLADLLARVELGRVEPGEVAVVPGGPATRPGHGSEPLGDPGWPGTVGTYDDRGATAPGKKDS